MINVTLPDEKSNYVHRIGRVGRAERMGLAISLVATVPEKVYACTRFLNGIASVIFSSRCGIMASGALHVVAIATIQGSLMKAVAVFGIMRKM